MHKKWAKSNVIGFINQIIIQFTSNAHTSNPSFNFQNLNSKNHQNISILGTCRRTTKNKFALQTHFYRSKNEILVINQTQRYSSTNPYSPSATLNFFQVATSVSSYELI